MHYNLTQKLIVGAVAVLAVAGNASAGPCRPRAAVTTVSTAPAGRGDTYINYRGNGSPEAGWPTKDQWISFDEMWATNAGLMADSCNQEWVGRKPSNSPHETEVLRQAIKKKADEGNVDARVVLAVVLQESHGCVHVKSSNNGVYNTGLMQSHAGLGDCQHIGGPCPDEQDGAIGTAAGDGLARILKGASSAQDAYRAARVYNSGSVAPSGDLADGNGSTGSYASDIANRLTGWVRADR